MKATQNDTQTETLVGGVISTWRAGAIPDARAFLDKHPELWQDKDVVLDLASEEYSLRRRKGEAITPSRYCKRFPAYQASLMRLMLVSEFMSRSPLVQRVVDDSLWPSVGQEFLGFRIVRQLGRGAFARVYLAEEQALGQRRVVIKVAQFAGREAEILGKLDHDHVTPVYSVKQHPDLCLTAVCMPYQGEATLSDVLDVAFGRGRPVQSMQPILDAVRLNPRARAVAGEIPKALRGVHYVDGIAYIGLKIAEALRYTHARGILHRDLKPSNVLIKANGDPVLLDFNLSTDSELDIARAGGTLPYMAPEQLYDVFLEPLRERPQDDPRADIYSWGVILYQLLAGQLPYQEPDASEPEDEAVRQMLKSQRLPPIPLRQLNPEVDAALERLVLRCLEIEADRRPPTAEALVEELQRRASVRQRLQRWGKRHRRAVAAVTLLAAATVGGGSLYWYHLPSWEVREYQRGLARLEAGDTRGAIATFQQLSVRAGDKAPDALFQLGRAYAHAKQWDNAVESFEAAHALAPSPRLLAWIGYCRSSQGSNWPALHFYEQAMHQGYRPAWLYNNVGYSHFRVGQARFAKKSLETAIQLMPESPVPYLNYAEVAFAHPDEFTASDVIDVAQRGVRLNPAEPALHHALARHLIRTGQAIDPRTRDEIRLHLETCLALDPTFFHESPSELSVYRDFFGNADIVQQAAPTSVSEVTRTKTLLRILPPTGNSDDVHLAAH